MTDSLRMMKWKKSLIYIFQRQKRELQKIEIPLFFEITTELAFQHFKNSGMQWASIEVGLGGRLDATNVIIPELSVITKIGYEHTDKLGTTLRDIAYEKSGIIKEGKPAVTGERKPEAFRANGRLTSHPPTFSCYRKCHSFQWQKWPCMHFPPGIFPLN